MNLKRFVSANLIAWFCLLCCAAPVHLAGIAGIQVRGGQPPQAPDRGSLFETVVGVLEERYFDERFRKEQIPRLADAYRTRAKKATSLKQQREVVHEFLSRIPASHLGILSERSFQSIFNELQGRRHPTLGFQLIEEKNEYYACMVLEGGPAERAGLLPWDRIVAIDGKKVSESPRLDWRTDDAYLTDERDPPMRELVAEAGEKIKFKIERRRRQFLEITVAVDSYSAFDAAKASARVMNVKGRRLAYIHFWLIHLTGVPELLKEKLDGEFADCDGLVLDLRGRGGNGAVLMRIVDLLRGKGSSWRRPIVALIDRQSRSAKDVLAYELQRQHVARLVGEPTAGAVIPASFARVGYESVLMFPRFKMPKYTDLLEFKPVNPDVFVKRAGPYSGGVDPIFKAGIEELSKML